MKKITKAQARKLIAKLFKPKEYKILKNDAELEGKVLIVNPQVVSPSAHTREGLLWKATGGFGCSPFCRGTCVMSERVSDGFESRWERYEFTAEFIAPTPHVETKETQ